jgi:hypothetical protein
MAMSEARKPIQDAPTGKMNWAIAPATTVWVEEPVVMTGEPEPEQAVGTTVKRLVPLPVFWRKT